MISPVRNLDLETKEKIEEYVRGQEWLGNQVYWPLRDTNQKKEEVEICKSNRKAIRKADEVHVWFDEESKGSLFDLGMAFAYHKKIVLVNKMKPTKKKSFRNFLLQYEQR